MKNCFICGAPYPEIHHIYFGTANRKQSDKYGFIVPLCYDHHRGPNGVHNNRALDLYLKRLYQKAFEQEHSREEFRRIFGKSYL